MKKFFVCLVTLIVFSVNILSISAEEAIPAVVEQNLRKMESVSDYGAEFVVDYVSDSGDYEVVKQVLDEIKRISDEVCAECQNDYEKICEIGNYVSGRLAYDHDAKHNAVTFDVISLENVLKKNRTTCAGYSNLFSSMCNAQGFYCVNIRGSAVSAEDGVFSNKLDDENTVMNHEWNAVYLEDEKRWVYMDCTWNSENDYENGEFNYGGFENRYTDISVEELSKKHKAILVDHREFFDALTVFENTETVTEISEIKQRNLETEIIEVSETVSESTEVVKGEKSKVSVVPFMISVPLVAIILMLVIMIISSKKK